jgi:hypothetical protein
MWPKFDINILSFVSPCIMTCLKLMYKLSHRHCVFRIVSYFNGKRYIEEEFGRSVVEDSWRVWRKPRKFSGWITGLHIENWSSNANRKRAKPNNSEIPKSHFWVSRLNITIGHYLLLVTVYVHFIGLVPVNKLVLSAYHCRILWQGKLF